MSVLTPRHAPSARRASLRARLSRMLVLSLVVAAVPLVQAPSASGAVTGLADCRFSSAQVFDVQWNISGGMLNISGVTRPYASNEPRSGQLTAGDIAATDTFAFYRNGAEVGFRQLDADSATKNTLHLQGTFRAIGEDFIFYLGDGFWGTVITTGAGFAYGSSASLAVDKENPTIDEVLTYTSCLATPLAAGETRDGGGGGDDGGGDGGGGDDGGGGGDDSDDNDGDPAPAPAGQQSAPVAAAIELAAGLAPTGAALVRDGGSSPVSTVIGPQRELVISDADGTLQVTLSTSSGVSPTRGLVVAEDGEIVCEICAQLAAGTVVEAWIHSEPRLAAAVRIDVEDGICPLLRIPVGTPLDGAGAIAPGAHTLQLRMDTGNGLEVLAVPIRIGDGVMTTTGTPVPTRVNTGGGPIPVLPLPLALGLLAAVAGLLIVQRDRELAWAHAWTARQRRRQALFGLHLPAFDALQLRVDELRRSLGTIALRTQDRDGDAIARRVERPLATTAADARFDALAQRLEQFRTENLG